MARRRRGAWSASLRDSIPPGNRSSESARQRRMASGRCGFKTRGAGGNCRGAQAQMNKVAGTRVLVTGGAGFVGSTIVDRLQAADAAEVRVLDNFIRGSWANLSPAKRGGSLEVIEGSICNPETVERAVAGADYIFHQAALRITRC